MIHPEPTQMEEGQPGESHKERVDRELGELLQGLRVAVTGVQVLFAFLLTVPFAPGFTKVDSLGRWLFFIALLSAALASVCFITPATQHRLLFRTGLKEKMLHRANEIGVVGAIGLAISMTSSVALVAETVINAWPAALFGGIVALTSAWLWFIQPIIDLYRIKHQKDVK
ncbi:hypothetical protein FHS43_002590 [Streptosporangium becharense]|uniref:Uncharacterized protein n=1 Tax=Streptosporangium becharense TaxID=1816182 RepID=A0A7W9IJ10_9ACTN|nr:DUF6328 family protein [Streptosporangium becharense]MBB2911325.1 hypothetical protein [Streptosporangium becharense]MBB5821617.1 hypothetical protein [Streptosporangium becharense]